MNYVRMSIEKESPEQLGYEKIKNNRLALLKNIDNLIKATADFSKIVPQ